VTSVATMTRALLYLRVASLAGRVKSRLRRLQQPKYLAGALVGAVYIYLTFLRRLLVAHPGYGPGRPGAGIPAAVAGLLPDIGAIILLTVLIVNWAIPRTAALAFSEAEIAFLFPAPVNRRMLVHYRLLGSQLAVVTTALIFTVVFGRGAGLSGNLWFHAIGWWLILATVNLHFMGTSFVYSKLLNRSLTSRWGRIAAIGGVWLAFCVPILWVCSRAHPPQPGDLTGAHEFAAYLAAQLQLAPVPWLLAIPKLVVAPYFAATGRAFALALGPALAILVAHYFWVLNIEVSFEEASIARAEKRAKKLRAVQQGDWRGPVAARKAQAPPFDLRRTGRPEVAFLWKNLLATSVIFRPKAAVVILAVALGGSEWLVRMPAMAGPRLFATSVCAMLLGFTLLLGPMFARQDLRTDLANADLLKAYPLRGWQVVLGELLTPLWILSGLVWLAVAAGFVLLPGEGLTWLNPALRVLAAVGLAILAPPLLAIQLLVPNAAAVLFPAWMASTATRGERGIEVMGQRIIFVAGQLLITAVALVPAAIGAALIFFVTGWLIGAQAAGVLAGMMAFALLCAEAFLGVLWLGGRFENFDLSAELRA
jgi:ABC-2 type transport system permease protein